MNVRFAQSADDPFSSSAIVAVKSKIVSARAPLRLRSGQASPAPKAFGALPNPCHPWDPWLSPLRELPRKKVKITVDITLGDCDNPPSTQTKTPEHSFRRSLVRRWNRNKPNNQK